jgi:hypothetical protein
LWHRGEREPNACKAALSVGVSQGAMPRSRKLASR